MESVGKDKVINVNKIKSSEIIKNDMINISLTPIRPISPISILNAKNSGNHHKRNGSESSFSNISVVSFSILPDLRNNIDPKLEEKPENKTRRLSLKSIKSLRWNSWQPTTATLKYFFSCFFYSIAIWIIFYILFDELAIPPKGSLFVIGFLEITSIIFGILFESLRLPPLLGMLSAGLLLGNLQIYAGPYFTIKRSISYPIRMISIVIVLTKGALNVNPSSIKEYKRIIPQLVVGSCLFEAAAACCFFYFILEFPFQWAALIGCIMSAMSGVGLLPYLAAFERCGVSDNRAILISRTACGLDALLAISLANITLGFIFSEGNITLGFKRGFLEILIGGLFGCFLGGINGIAFGKGKGNLERVLAVFSCGIISYLGLPKLGFPLGAPLGCFLNTLVASTIWRSEDETDINEKLIASFDKIWILSQAILFGIVGFRTNLHIVDWNLILKGVICLGLSLAVRLISVFTFVSCGDLKMKEKLFLCLAWIPKCTVQATTGPVAIDTAIQFGLTDEIVDYGNKILALSVMTIVVSTSIGALTSLMLAPRVLHIPR